MRCRMDCVCVFVYVCVWGLMRSCVLFVTYDAMLYDLFWGCLCLCVLVFLLTVLGCRACELLCDDAWWSVLLCL